MNNKGFSIIELFAVILIATAIIFPAMTTLVNNFEINDRLHDRRSSTSIAQGTLYGLQRLNFDDIEAAVIQANNDGLYYIELNNSNYSDYLPDSADQALCDKLFSTIWNNVTLDETNFRVFIYNFNLPDTSPNLYKTTLLNNTLIPGAVRDQISLIEPLSTENPQLYRVTIWIRYNEEAQSVVTLNGLISND